MANLWVNTSRRDPHVGSCVFLARQGTPMTDPSAHCQPVPWWKHLHPCICHRTSWFAWTSPRCETLREPPFEVIQVLLGCQSPKGIQRASLCEMIKISSWSLVLFWISTDYHQARLIFLAKVQRQPQTFQQRGKWELGQLFIPPCPSISCCPPNRKRGAQGAPSRYPPVPLCPRSAPSSPPSAAPCQTSAYLGFRRGRREVMVEPRSS